MPSTVAVTRRAQHQMALIADYLNERNPAAARHFHDRMATAYRQLSEFPLSGPRSQLPNSRRLIVAPYVLTYRIIGDRVEIVDIRHGRQRPFAVPRGG